MTTLTRSDGVQFVIQAYRERIKTRRRALAVQQIRLIAEQLGNYAQLFKKGSQLVEAVFAKEPGFLLGESIWQFFGNPENLIFVEALPDSAQILLVVVRGGSVYLDMKILSGDLRQELLPLMAEQYKYRVVTSGDVPLQANATKDGFTLPDNIVQEFEMLSKPLFPRLPALVACQLQPLPIVLKAQRLSGQIPFALILMVIILVAGGAWWLLKKPKPVPITPTVHAKVSPYQIYRRALTSAAPQQQLTQLNNTIIQLLNLTGWDIHQINYDGANYQVQLYSTGGNLEELSQWTKRNQYLYSFNSQGVQLSYYSQLPVRRAPDKIYPMKQVIDYLADQFNTLLMNNNAVKIGQTLQKGNISSAAITIGLSQDSPDVLLGLARLLKNMPVVLHKASLNMRNSLITGHIELEVWGS